MPSDSSVSVVSAAVDSRGLMSTQNLELERSPLETLEHYLLEEKPIDVRDVKELDELLNDTVKVFDVQFDSSSAWPYDVPVSSKSKPSDGLSVSTTSMILCALLRMGGFFNTVNSNAVVGSRETIFPTPALSDKTMGNIKSASKALLQRISQIAETRGIAGGMFATSSGTYGDDDVFSLAWLTNLSAAPWKALVPEDEESWAAVRREATKLANRKFDRSNGLQLPSALFSPPTGEPLAHSFPSLKLLQVLISTGSPPTSELGSSYKYFENSLHQQLSYSSIPDSRFDPAELVFSLEGMLLSERSSVDRRLFDRVHSVLDSVQKDNPYWRPVKPFLATEKGLVLFPVSVEVANSILRCCSIIDGGNLHDTYGSRSIPLLRRYWQWLKARAVRLSVNGHALVGWHSEHVNAVNTIHLWETSQVVEFLLAYRNALLSHIARTTLIRSRFSVENHPRQDWDSLREKFEAVTVLGDDLRIYERIGRDFVVPTLEHQNKQNYSMLLYGPPGTGKTQVAESIARALGRRLIKITVSDFLAGGGGQVEARAKNIFDVLSSQPACVILFDEIDHFLLDRDSDWYAKQDTIFQFMTPGMLTKLNELRGMKTSLFIVATNYEDRIDAAIKRTGRIDYKYLVLPPDAFRRKKLLTEHLTPRDEKSGGGTESFVSSLREDDWKDLERESLFLGYKDIEAAVGVFRRSGEQTPQRLGDLLKNRARTISLEGYTSRFYDAERKPLDARQTPIGEYLCLIALLCETARDLEDYEKPSANAALAVIRGSTEMPPATREVTRLVKRHAPDLSQTWCSKVAGILCKA
jgi:ATPase family associated with various cellular activities (AAA)